eukprot:COSAG01_NODE_109_length_25925_cov_48.384961_12_plen_342_part_00
MASKNLYENYNNDALKHFGLEDETYYGLVTSGTEIADVLITQNTSVFDKVRDLLSNNTIADNKIKDYKRGFVLSKCPVTLDRIKSSAKEHKVTITNDYEKADFLISHDNIYTDYNNSEKILSTQLMYKLWNYEAFSETNGRCSFIENYHRKVIYDDKLSTYFNTWHGFNGDDLMEEWIITPVALNLAYLIDIGELKVLSVENLLHASGNITPLTEDMVIELTNWCQSYDDDNKAIAAKILPTVDYTKKHHLMWKLAQEIGSYTYNFNRDKDVQYWLEASRLSEYYHMSAQDMILTLESESKLNPEAFKYLEKIVRKEISIHNRDLYVFKVSVKSEYKKYLK